MTNTTTTTLPSTRTEHIENGTRTAHAPAAPTLAANVLAASALAIPRSGIRDIFDRAERVPDCISLAVGEPGETAAAHIAEAGCRAIREGDTHYTNVLGTEEFRRAAAGYTRRVKGLDYDPASEIQAIDGATIGLYLALKAVVDPGDEVPGSAFGKAGAGFVRLSYAGDAANVREGARRMRAFADRL